MELQHQLCATEATAGSLRDVNSELKSRIDLLEADKVSSTMWQQSKVWGYWGEFEIAVVVTNVVGSSTNAVFNS